MRVYLLFSPLLPLATFGRVRPCCPSQHWSFRPRIVVFALFSFFFLQKRAVVPFIGP